MTQTTGTDFNYKMISTPLSSFLSFMLITAVLVLTIVTPLSAQNADQSLTVPAEYSYRLTLPGEMNELLRPGRMFVDRHFGEVFVSDPGHNRIAIFDQNGVYRFEFYGTDLFGSAHDIVVDSKGYIYVVGTTISGHELFKFDFDGTLIDTLEVNGIVTNTRRKIGSLAIDDNDNLYLLLPDQQEVISLTTDGTERYRFDVTPDLSEENRREAVFGSITVDGDRLYLPISSLRQVRVYDLQGHQIKSFGVAGNLTGQFNFPVEVAVSSDDIIMILDKHRFIVLCFSEDFRFLGEFGGKGFNPGWFYYPDKLVVDTLDQVYIGQVFNNWVQVVSIPDFIKNKVALNSSEPASLARENTEDNNKVELIPNEAASDGTPPVSLAP